VPSIEAVLPLHVATWIEAQTRELAAPSVKQRLAARSALLLAAAPAPAFCGVSARAR